MIPGHATPEGTRRYHQTHAGLDFRALGQTGLTASQIGFGGYRVAQGIAAHRWALTEALLQGINLIDTSTNYADGQSEALVGEVLAELIGGGRIARDEVVIVSKVGYLQGANFELSQQRKAQGRPFPELVPYGQGLEHCLHPEFIADQLTRSLERLGLETLDVYLLHNPEYYLSWGQKKDIALDTLRKEYYRRLKAAFRHLEREAEKGRLQYYGVSSNTFPVPRENGQFTDLSQLDEIAAQIAAESGKAHRFRVIQLPLNLLESGAALEPNQPGSQTCLSWAAARKIAVLVNRPLNAFDGRQLLRLADPEVRPQLSDDEIVSAIEAAAQSEKTFVQNLLPRLELSLSLTQRLSEQLGTADSLKQHWRDFGSYGHWRQVRDDLLMPRIRGVFDFLQSQEPEIEGLQGWLAQHPQTLTAAFEAVDSVYVGSLLRRLRALKQRLQAADPEWADAPSLSRMAVRALRSTAGVSTVLVGMRQKAYVQEMIAELEHSISAQDREDAWRMLAKGDGH
ncbi:MAG: aldo/keto reductase [Desulfobacterales bacterium]